MSGMTTATKAALDSLLSHLNPEHRAAANHGHEPLLIVAGAGTGKTTTLAHRVAPQKARRLSNKTLPNFEEHSCGLVVLTVA